uniref:Very-long-chain 3-oxoacyl-CoA synthase n=1 Tax=Pyramimonas obovata TaxID=1411642 RepID=A0A7S0WT84_9CHLO|mmetsp:Transcript_38841/g.84552  ORF Transcript_38841/g.84552 Transcript_38841/m.84552 type:complete len:297 (+) Transcript_38841:192-1082(+)|eukprot:CAMPEP_0118932966 /NCGR_PEP_ID=MMETSP1169-20130426/10814_1 /TAXON_ID=36882 /ORGANISM="Pyramimonas obovata, Strain CCMP722" /LENGTH=296 /DNA_ID=CAMNT_0006875675 /DNA_START=185 /DNA_END=1075 /DNA_ORIENTATION=+
MEFAQPLLAMAQEKYAAIDAVVAPAVFGATESVGWGLKPISSATKDLPLVESPTPLILSLMAYFAIVGSGLVYRKAFPRTVKGQDPFLLKALMLVHNIFLIGLSLYMCLKIVYEAYLNKYSFWGNAYNPAQTEMAKVIWIFYVSKIYEFMDTFIMLLKGNVNQVSFLHVYHHGSISGIWWMISYAAPGGDAYFSAALNSWVHVCMYTYYFMAAVLPKDEKTRRKYLWWGRYLTQMQMFQFFMNLIQAVYCLNFSPYPKFLSQLLVVYMVTLLMLFGNFYYMKHCASKKQKLASKKQ